MFRFLGACNTTTDIKEANFLGSHGQFIMAGSDDGKFFIWDRRSGNIVRVLVGDESIVNCLQVIRERRNKLKTKRNEFSGASQKIQIKIRK